MYWCPRKQGPASSRSTIYVDLFRAKLEISVAQIVRQICQFCRIMGAGRAILLAKKEDKFNQKIAVQKTRRSSTVVVHSVRFQGSYIVLVSDWLSESVKIKMRKI